MVTALRKSSHSSVALSKMFPTRSIILAVGNKLILTHDTVAMDITVQKESVNVSMSQPDDAERLA